MATTTNENTKGHIVIVGATGPTGLQLVQQALERGYTVIAPVRNPQKLEHIENQNLKVIQCDLMDPQDLTKHLEGCLAVLSALGQPGFQMKPMTFYQDSIKSLVTAMRNANIKRLICMTSMYTKYQPEKYPFFYRIFIRPMIGRHLDSMFIMEEYLEKECRDLDYTIVRPPRLMDEPMIEKEVKVCENDYYFPDQSTAMRIPRANVAHFMLDIFNENKYLRQGVAVDLSKN